MTVFTSILFSQPEFTVQEREWIKNNNTVIVGGEFDWAPFEFVDAKGKYQGITNDYLTLISEKTGLKFKVLTGFSWNQLIENFKAGKFDILPSVYYAPEREKIGSFTVSYYTVRDYLFVKDESKIGHFDDLNGKVLAIPKGYTVIEKIKREYPKITILETRSIMDSIASVLNDKADAALEVQAVMSYILKTNAIDGIKVVAQDAVDVHQLQMLVQKDKHILLSIINKAIHEIDQDEQTEIAHKWINIHRDNIIEAETLIKFVTGIFIVFIFMVYRQYILRKHNSQLEDDRKLINKYLKIIDENVITSSTDDKGIITNISNAFCQISGYEKEELLGKTHSVIRHPDMEDTIYKEMWKTIKSDQVWHGELKNIKKSGDYYWLDITISPRFNGDKKIIGYTSVGHNITDKKIVETLAITDSLTQIYNRGYFNNVFTKEINRAKRENRYFCFISMDVDFFKKYNDTYGHQEGDEVLIAIGKVLNNSTRRAGDIAFRLGGEEFGIIFSEIDEKKSLEYAQKIKDSIEGLKIEHKNNSASPFITVSIGLFVQKGKLLKTSDEIYKLADDLLYKSKENGRNQISTNFS